MLNFFTFNLRLCLLLGKLPLLGSRRGYSRRGLNLGNLLTHGRHNGVGFHQLTTLDNDLNNDDELDPLHCSDDSDVEEFSSIALHQRPA